MTGSVIRLGYYVEMDPKSDKRTRVLAQQAVARARRRGDLLRPDACEECGALGVPHAHHDDYSKPLVVCWLCRLCHAARHAEVGWLPQARRLRAGGASYVQVARVVGVGESTVWKRLNPDKAREHARRDNIARAPAKRAHEREWKRDPANRGRCLTCGGSMGVGIPYDGTCRSCKPARIAQLIEMWTEGLTAAEIAERLGRSKYGVRVEISKLRAKGYDIPHRRTPEQVKRIAEASARGLGRLPPTGSGSAPI